MVSADFLRGLANDDRVHAIQELGQPVVEANRIGRIAAGFSVGCALAGCIFTGSLPKPVVTLLLLCGVGASAQQYARLKDLNRNQAIAAIDATNESAMAALGERLQAAQGLERTAQQAENYRKLALLIARQPAVFQPGLADEFGITHLLGSRLQPQSPALPPSPPQTATSLTSNGVRQIGVDGSGIPSFIEEQQRQQSMADPWPQAPTRDIAEEIAGLSFADLVNLLIVAKPGSGKSAFLSTLQDSAVNNGRQVLTIDGKSCSDLDKSSIKYIRCNRPERVESAGVALQGLLKEMYARQDRDEKGAGITLIVDEWNALLEVAAIFDQQQKAEAPRGEKPPSLVDELKSALKLISLQGRSEGIQVVLTSHSPNVEDLGMNTGNQTAFSFMALSRNGNHESIQGMLNKKGLLSEDQKSRLQSQFATLQNYAEGVPLVLTTFYPAGFYRLPSLVPVSTEELMEDVGVSDLQDSSVERAESAAFLYTLRDWLAENEGASLAAIAQQWIKISGCSAEEAVAQAALLEKLCTASDEVFEKSVEMYLSKER